MRKLLFVCALLVAGSSAFAQVGIEQKIETPRPPLPLASALYKSLKTPFLFVTPQGQATSLLSNYREVALGAAQQGLNPANYWPATFDQQLANLNASNAAVFEMSVVQSLLAYARDLSVGRVNPTDVGGEIKVLPQPLDVEKLSTALSNTTGTLEQNLNQQLAPKYPQYQQLLEVLRIYRQIPDSYLPPVSAPKHNLKLRSSDPVVTNVKIRLHTLGFSISDSSTEVTIELLQAVSLYMKLQNLPPPSDLSRSSAFWAHLGTSKAERISQIEMGLEKLRWLPSSGDRYVFVNLAFQKMRVFENGNVVLEMNTVNGRPERKSPMLHDRVVNVELNPTWTVPSKLLIEDKVPHILKDPTYLQENNYVVLDPTLHQEIDPASVNWAALTKKTAGLITLRQGPGLGNALGVMKFNLTNPYAIYMHDTNERELFGNQQRLLSSGCIRLQQPLDFAAYLLRDNPKWDSPSKFEEHLATQKVAESSVKPQLYIILKKPVPVNLVYLTTDVDVNGHVSFANDYYRQDARLRALLQSRGF